MPLGVSLFGTDQATWYWFYYVIFKYCVIVYVCLGNTVMLFVKVLFYFSPYKQFREEVFVPNIWYPWADVLVKEALELYVGMSS